MGYYFTVDGLSFEAQVANSTLNHFQFDFEVPAAAFLVNVQTYTNCILTSNSDNPTDVFSPDVVSLQVYTGESLNHFVRQICSLKTYFSTQRTDHRSGICERNVNFHQLSERH